MAKDKEGKKKVIHKFKVGKDKRYVLAVEKYKGKPMLVLREQYQDDDEWRWGRNGLNLNLKKVEQEDLLALAKGIKKIAQEEMNEEEESEEDEDEDDEDEKPKKKKKKDEDDDDDEDEDEEDDE